MPEQLMDTEKSGRADLRRLEASLQSLWEKARIVSDQLLKLKAENKELLERISSLESKETRWNEELQRKERELEELRLKLTQTQSNGKNIFTKEELELLKTRLKALIEKINSRL